MKETMNTRKFATAQKNLREQQRRLLDAIRTHLAVSGSDQMQVMANQHEATDDDAIADVLAEMDLATLAAELNELRDIQLARRRIADGSYGICVQCGSDIPAARLEASPTALRCISCQAGIEAAAGKLRNNSI
jgi:DnaK suppressor protein